MSSSAMDRSSVLDCFPENFHYDIQTFKVQEFDAGCGEKRTGFVSKVMVAGVHDKKEALDWIREYETLSGTQWRSRTTYASKLPASQVFKAGYRCHHNTRPSQQKGKATNTTPKTSKNTACEASMMISVFNKDAKRGLLSGPEHRMMVYLKHNHNHTIHSADALKHRRPTEEVKLKFHALFRAGHSASTALMTHKFDLLEKYEDDYFKYAADGAYCPSMKWCYYQYNNIFKLKYGDVDDEPMVDSLKRAIATYNINCGMKCADFIHEKGDKPSTSDLVVAICTPFMRRVHSYLKSSSQICFVDGRVLVLVAPSAAGALPLGIIMTYSESQEALRKGFLLLKGLLPKDAFCGNGFPEIFMTNDCTPLRKVLNLCFENSLLLLSTFDVLQAFWRWLWGSSNRMNKHEKSHIYFLLKKVLRSEDEIEFNVVFDELLNDSIVFKHEELEEHLKSLKKRSPEWALFYRTDVLTRGYHLNNYCEAAFRVMNDKIFLQLKAFNVVQTFDFLMTRFYSYVERRVADCISNCSMKICRQYSIPISTTNNLECNQISLDEYEVSNVDKTIGYVVNTFLETCTCKVGSCGAFCKHQYAVILKYNISSNQFLPHTDDVIKKNLHLILYGSEAPKDQCEGLRDECVSSACEVYEHEQLVVKEEDASEADNAMDEASVDLDLVLRDRIDKARREFDEVAQQIKASMELKPDLFVPAIEQFVSNFKNLKSECDLVAALEMFGNMSNSPSSSTNQGNIPVDPAATPRHKAYFEGRHEQCQAGTSPKDFVLVEQQKRGADDAWPKPPAKRESHNFSRCVARGKSLGRSQSKK